MPDTSCRNCGGNLTDYTICAVCKKTISRICMRCDTTTLEEFHNDGFSPETEYLHSGVVILMKNKALR